MPGIIHQYIGRTIRIATLLAVMGVYSYFSAREWGAKWAFAHQTEFGVDALVRIAIPQTDLSHQTDFLVSQEEFAWQGEMVDVLHREIRSDTLYIYGFRDDTETELKREAPWLYADTTHPDSLPDTDTKRAKWFSPFVLPDGAKLSPLTDYFVPNVLGWLGYSSPRSGLPLLEVPSPPPDFQPTA